MQMNEIVRIYTDASKTESHIALVYLGDSIYTIENETNGECLTITREELYDICQKIFARR